MNENNYNVKRAILCDRLKGQNLVTKTQVLSLQFTF